MRYTSYFVPSFIYIIAFGLALSACSPTDDSQASADYASENDTYTDEGLDDSAESLEGWRKGTMTVSVSVHQAGEAEEQSTASGGTRAFISWQFTLEAQQTFAVEVVPDLSILLPATNDAEELRAAFDSSPVSWDELELLPTPSGKVTYAKQFTVGTPNANDFTSVSETVNGVGSISALSIRNLKPSMYGNGYELDLHLDYSLLLNSVNTSKPVNGETIRAESSHDISELIHLSLFPAPDINTFNGYPFDEHHELPPELRNEERKNKMNLFSALEQVAAGAQPLGQLRPGMSWQATPDQLKLSYSAPTDMQLPMFGDITGLATNINPNRVYIEIVIKAQP